MSIHNYCQSYFCPSIFDNGHVSAKKCFTATCKVISYFSVVLPIFIGLTCLCFRPKSSLNNKKIVENGNASNGPGNDRSSAGIGNRTTISAVNTAAGITLTPPSSTDSASTVFPLAHPTPHPVASNNSPSSNASATLGSLSLLSPPHAVPDHLRASIISLPVINFSAAPASPLNITVPFAGLPLASNNVQFAITQTDVITPLAPPIVPVSLASPKVSIALPTPALIAPVASSSQSGSGQSVNLSPAALTSKKIGSGVKKRRKKTGVKSASPGVKNASVASSVDSSVAEKFGDRPFIRTQSEFDRRGLREGF